MTKLNPAGSGLVYSTYLGGSGRDDGYGIAVDGAGNAYVTGIPRSTNFPTTSGAFPGGLRRRIRRRLRDEAERDRHRAALLHLPRWQRVDDDGFGIAVDGSGNAYVTGYDSTNFPHQERLPAHFRRAGTTLSWRN